MTFIYDKNDLILSIHVPTTTTHPVTYILTPNWESCFEAGYILERALLT